MKIRFLKLWDLLGYFEITTSKRPTCVLAITIPWQIVLEIYVLVPFCPDDSMQILLNLTWFL